MGIDGIGAGIGCARFVFASLRFDRDPCRNGRWCHSRECLRMWCAVGTARSLWSPHDLDCHTVGCGGVGACIWKIARAGEAAPRCPVLIFDAAELASTHCLLELLRPCIVLILHEQEGSMRKPLSMAAIAAYAILIGSTAIAVAGSESIDARYLQLAQLPTDPPVI